MKQFELAIKYYFLYKTTLFNIINIFTNIYKRLNKYWQIHKVPWKLHLVFQPPPPPPPPTPPPQKKHIQKLES